MTAARPANANRVAYRSRPQRRDVAALRRLVASIGVFYPEERKIALELLT